ncbi:hypothetical protein P8452_12844 [Trifolium repens]|nr:hypothetical protein P8452_12844 [Trifolium repens]
MLDVHALFFNCDVKFFEVDYINLVFREGECSKEGEEYPLFESWSLILFEIWRKLLRWSFRTALLGMELIRHSYSQSAE